MNWYKGNIAEAVAMSRTKNAIFVVYIEGRDELTEKLTNFINDAKIKSKLESDDFVAIKVESDSQAYMQFAKIYQVVPVPSIFFIGSAGTPLEIATGITASTQELEEKIEKVLSVCGKADNSAAKASSTLIAAEQTAIADEVAPTTSSAAIKTVQQDAEEIVCDGDVCVKQQKKTQNVDEPVGKQDGQETVTDAADVSSRLEETRKLLEQKRRERIELEQKLEKERELRRKRDGKEMQQSQSWQKAQELKDLKDNIRRERMEEQAVREHIRAQIASDRAERAYKSSVETQAANAVASTAASAPQPCSSTDNARLQFRLSTGDTKTQSFSCQETLSVVREFVKSEILPGTGIRDFVLATTYPKREFNAEHAEQTLEDLGLFPSAVILVIGKTSSVNPAAIIARSGGLVNVLSTLFWALLSPMFAVYGYLKNIRGARGEADDAAANVGAQKRANEEQGAQHDAAKRRNLDRFLTGPSTSKPTPDTPVASSSTPFTGADNTIDPNSTKPYRRYVGGSNIHRLTDKKKDTDDDNATWNGNSTQQQ